MDKSMIDVLIVKFIKGLEAERRVFDDISKIIKNDCRLLLSVYDNDSDNIGLTRARNKLVNKTSLPFICFMDFDLDPLRLNLDWDGMIRGLKDDVGMIMPRALTFDCPSGSEYIEIKQGCHCHLMLMRRKVLEEIGGLDSRFFLFRADLDLIRRLRQRGLKIVQHTPSVIYHGNFSQYNPNAKKIHQQDLLKYQEKWGDSNY